MTVEGIDLSYAETRTPSLAGLGFTICKASEGNFADSRYAQHSAATRAEGLKLGAYHFGRLEWSAAEQAALLLRVAPGADFYAWDHERSPSAGTIPTEAQAREFIALVQKAGKNVLLYGSQNDPNPPFPAAWKGDRLGANASWVAAPGFTPSVPYLFVQYSQARLDRDRFAGTADELAAFCGQPTGGAVKFVQLSSADVAGLPTIKVPAKTPIEDFAGEQWDTVGPTTLHVLPGLVDAHTNRRQVVVTTARFYADGVARPTAQVAVLG